MYSTGSINAAGGCSGGIALFWDLVIAIVALLLLLLLLI